ncbi:MAG TPA: hypothetical protein V6D14_11685 [Coleofasciculaceae cyanobacterium]
MKQSPVKFGNNAPINPIPIGTDYKVVETVATRINKIDLLNPPYLGEARRRDSLYLKQERG